MFLTPVFRRRRQQRPQDQNEDQPWLVLIFSRCGYDLWL